MKPLILTTGLLASLFGLALCAAMVQTANATDVIQHNHSVPDVVAAFNNLAPRAEALGFWKSVDSPEAYPRPKKNHFQGIARSPRTGQAPVFYLAYSGSDAPVTDDYGALMVVQMASRPQNGERMRSNRLERDTPTWQTEPQHEGDKVVKVYRCVDYNHPCGMSMVGDILAVPKQGNRILITSLSNFLSGA